MRVNDSHELSASLPPRTEPPDQTPPTLPDQESTSRTRRGFLGQSARKLAYTAPVVLLFRPKSACAVSGVSQVS